MGDQALQKKELPPQLASQVRQLIDERVEQRVTAIAASIESTNTLHVSGFPSTKDIETLEKYSPGITDRMMGHIEKTQADNHQGQLEGQRFAFGANLFSQTILAILVIGALRWSYLLLIADKDLATALAPTLTAVGSIALAVWGNKQTSQRPAAKEPPNHD